MGHSFLVHTLEPKTQVPHFTLWPLVSSYKTLRPRPVSVPVLGDSTVHNIQHIMEQNDTTFCQLQDKLLAQSGNLKTSQRHDTSLWKEWQTAATAYCHIKECIQIPGK